ncbi:MAG: hypothetical protein QFB89_01190 [Pseudomonadota bacterium]|nr:hypothetical protein [Pseudomonadota bacterium]
MTSRPNRAAQPPQPADVSPEPLELTPDLSLEDSSAFDSATWAEVQAEHSGAGGRAVLGWTLSILAALWLSYAAWSAGRTLAGQSLTSPAVAQWVAVAAGPLALLGLLWLMFGRTRRKEAERFTRSVRTMRAEAHSLEALLEVLTQRLSDSHGSLKSMAEQLMGLGDQATGKFDGISRDLDSSSERLARHGETLDRAAESARTDLGVLLTDLPRAEETARLLAEQLRAIGSNSAEKAFHFGEQISQLSARAREADDSMGQSSQRMTERLAEIERAGSAAAASVNDAEASFSGALDSLLERTAQTLETIRAGIDVQSAAVSALVDQSAAGISSAGITSAEAMANHVGRADALLEGLGGKVAEQEASSKRMLGDIDQGLALIDQRFAELASSGDQRAAHFLDSLTRARSALDGLADQAGAQDDVIGRLAVQTETVRVHIDRLAEVAQTLRPEIGWVRDAAVEASEKIGASGGHLADQQERLAALLATIDDGVGDAQSKLVALTASITQTQAEAAALTAETGPSLVAALLQVKEAAAHAADRAREAIEAVIPESAGKLSARAREELERVIRDSIVERLREVEGVAATAVEAARGASDRLTQQMISLGQTASALEAHIEHTGTDQREKDSEAFARRVALLMDSMNSAAIDVGKILSDEIDDKAWDSYLKGNRGVFTRRAVRLLGGGEARAIRTHYDSDMEFQHSVNRYVHDFEAMLRRVLAERDGGMIAVTLMSSDMGKLYAALGQAVDRRR